MQCFTKIQIFFFVSVVKSASLCASLSASLVKYQDILKNKTIEKDGRDT